jgi:hypothetical protein
MNVFSSYFFAPTSPDQMNNVSFDTLHATTPTGHSHVQHSGSGEQGRMQQQYQECKQNDTLSNLSFSRTSTTGKLTMSDVDTKAVDEMLSKELNKISFTDRSAINEEVHGVRNLAVVETPQMIERSLWAMQTEIDRIKQKPAYEQAVYIMQSRWIMQDPNLRLRFLRTERFDVTKAARRFVRFWDLVLKYYGTVALQRPIRMSDLGKEEMELLRSGEYQFLPFRDRSGRRILSCLGRVGLTYSLYARVSQ